MDRAHGLQPLQHAIGEAHPRSLLELLPVMVCLKGRDGRYRYANAAFHRLCDPTGRGVRGRTVFDLCCAGATRFVQHMRARHALCAG